MTFITIVEALAKIVTPDNINEVIQIIDKLIALEQSIAKSANSNSSQNSSAK